MVKDSPPAAARAGGPNRTIIGRPTLPALARRVPAMTPGVLPDIFSQIPDLPRWVDARGLLLSRRGFLVNAADGCRVVCGRADRLIVPVTFDLTRELDAIAAREVTGPATIVLQEVMLPSARWLLQEWEADARNGVRAVARAGARTGACRSGRPRPSARASWRPR